MLKDLFLVLWANFTALEEKPIPGERWVHRDTSGDPWGPKNHCSRNFGCKEGWVRYKFSFSNLRSDERKDMSTFLFIYQLKRMNLTLR
jgi:hypothetical protein